MNLLSKVWNKIVDIYYNIYEWFYITFNKTTYWQYELESSTVYCSISGGEMYITYTGEPFYTTLVVYCSISGGKMYITLSDYRMLERDIIGRKLLNEFKDKQIPIKIII